jgi:hypothetical protein
LGEISIIFLKYVEIKKSKPREKSMEDKELQEILESFKQAFENNKIKLNDLELLKSMKNVKILANGKVDLNTVNSRVRAAARAYFLSQRKKS